MPVMTAAAKTFTGYVMLKHRECGHKTRVEVGLGWGSERFVNISARTPCSHCGEPLRTIYGVPIMGRSSDLTTCGTKCRNATGPDCECPCVGANHGISHEID